MQKVNSGTAYLLWCLCLFGICGAQRFYTGNIVSGVIYLLTFGFFYIGQLIDLALIPEMVDKRNRYLSGSENPNLPGVNPYVTLNIGSMPSFPASEPLQGAHGGQLPRPSSPSPMHKLLRAAKEQGGRLSVAQAAMYTELDPKQVQELLEEATRVGYAEITNDPETGAIRYQFDL